MKSFYKLLVFFFLTMVIAVNASAFRVQNNFSHLIYVEQVAGGNDNDWFDFYAKINPGDWAACSYTDENCNAGGKTHPTNPITFKISYKVKDSWFDPKFATCSLTEPANANIIVIDIPAGGTCITQTAGVEQ